MPRAAAGEIPVMDGTTDIPPNPPYPRDPAAAGATVNPSAGLTTSSSAGDAPTPSTDLTLGLFMAPG